MVAGLSVKNRVQMFESGRPKSSPRHRLSPRERMARLSPRIRFSGEKLKPIKLEDGDPPTITSTATATTLTKNVAITSSTGTISSSGNANTIISTSTSTSIPSTSATSPYNVIFKRTKKTVSIVADESTAFKNRDENSQHIFKKHNSNSHNSNNMSDLKDTFSRSIPGSSVPPKSPRTRQPIIAKNWNHLGFQLQQENTTAEASLTTKMDSFLEPSEEDEKQDIATDSRAPVPKSPRQPSSPRHHNPRSPRASSSASSPRAGDHPHHNIQQNVNVKYAELNDELDKNVVVCTTSRSSSRDNAEDASFDLGSACGGGGSGSPLVKQARIFKKSPKYKPEWQLNRNKIMGGRKGYMSPLSLRKQRMKEQESGGEVKPKQKKTTSAVFWPEDDNEDEQETGSMVYHQTKHAPPKLHIPKSPSASLALQIPRSPSASTAAHVPRSPSASMPHQIPRSPSATMAHHQIPKSPSSLSLAPSSRDSPRGRSSRQSQWRTAREESRARSPSPVHHHQTTTTTTMLRARSCSPSPKCRQSNSGASSPSHASIHRESSKARSPSSTHHDRMSRATTTRSPSPVHHGFQNKAPAPLQSIQFECKSPTNGTVANEMRRVKPEAIAPVVNNDIRKLSTNGTEHHKMTTDTVNGTFVISTRRTDKVDPPEERDFRTVVNKSEEDDEELDKFLNEIDDSSSDPTNSLAFILSDVEENQGTDDARPEPEITLENNVGFKVQQHNDKKTLPSPKRAADMKPKSDKCNAYAPEMVTPKHARHEDVNTTTNTVDLGVVNPDEHKGEDKDNKNCDMTSSESSKNASRKEARLSRATRLRNMRAQSPLVMKYHKGSDILKQTLDAASVVIQDEKASSVGSGGSDRSCLSNEELSNIASKALNMSRAASRQAKLVRSTPLNHLLKQRADKKQNKADSGRADKTNVECNLHTNINMQATVETAASIAMAENKKQKVISEKTAETNSNDVFSQFPIISRSYRNTRLAKMYLHRAHLFDNGPSTTTSDSGANSVDLEGAADTTDRNEPGPEEKMPRKEGLRGHEQMVAAGPEQKPPTSKSSGHISQGLVSFQKDQVDDDDSVLVPNSSIVENSSMVSNSSSTSKPHVRVSLISAVQNKKERLALLSTAQQLKPSTQKGTKVQNARIARANAIVAKHRQAVTNSDQSDITEEEKVEIPLNSTDVRIKEPPAESTSSTVSVKSVETSGEDVFGSLEIDGANAVTESVQSKTIKSVVSTVDLSKTDTTKEEETVFSGVTDNREGPEKPTPRKKDSGPPNDIFSRTARRRQHPAFAARTQTKLAGKRKKTTHPSTGQTSVKETKGLSPSKEIKGQSFVNEETQDKISTSTSSTSSTSADLINNPSINSIFGDKKGIAFAYWKYSQAKGKEASHGQTSEINIASSANNPSNTTMTRPGTAPSTTQKPSPTKKGSGCSELEPSYITKREENMHSFHELEAEEGHSLGELTSDFTLSLPSGSSEERSATQDGQKCGNKEGTATHKTPPEKTETRQTFSAEKDGHNLNHTPGGRHETLSSDCGSEAESGLLLGEIFTNLSSADDRTGADDALRHSKPISRSLSGVLEPSFEEDVSCAGTADDSMFNLKPPNPIGSQSICGDSVHFQSSYDDQEGALQQLYSKASLKSILHTVAEVVDEQAISSPRENDNEASSHMENDEKLSSIPEVSTEREKQALVAASTWNCGERPLVPADDTKKKRARATHKRCLHSDRKEETRFKYQDLRSLSLPDKSLVVLARNRSFDSDHGADYDVFSGIDDNVVDQAKNESSSTQHTSRSPAVPPPPPPPPPLPRMDGRVLDAASTLKTVNSDITSSLIGGDRLIDISAIKAVNSDITSSLLAGERRFQQYCSDDNEVGIVLINEFEEGAEGVGIEYLDSRFVSGSSPSRRAAKIPIENRNTQQSAKTSSNERTRENLTINKNALSSGKSAKQVGKRLIDPTNISVMDSSMIMKMGLSIMESLSGGMISFGRDMPNADKLFGVTEDFSGSAPSESYEQDIQVEEGAKADANVPVQASSNPPTEVQSSEEKTTEDSNVEMKIEIESYDDDESEESRYIPDIDDYSRETDDCESEISLILLEEVKTTPDLVPDGTADSSLSTERTNSLVRFSSACKFQGIEVLKLNRRNKWQPRFLTMSSETFKLHRVNDLAAYPKALLWVKKFSVNQTYSLVTISSEGRGGVEFSKIESLNLETSENHPPKAFPKFKNSVQVNLHYDCGGTSRSLAFRFKSEADASFFTSSIEYIMDILDYEGTLA